MIRVNGYPVDCALEERLRYEADVTDLDIESGSDPSDHIRPKQPVLEFDGIVSDTPLGEVASDPSRQADSGSPTPSRDAFDRFVAIHEAGQPVVVECTYGKFDSMAMTSLSPERTVETAKAFKFTATFKRIKIRENKRTTVRVAIPNGTGKQNLGSREALYKYLGQNMVWVKSIARESDGNLAQRLATGGGLDQPIGSALHKPVVHPIYGAPVLSTTSLDRVGSNGYDRFGGVWVDHYKLATGDKETSKTMLLSDGYVVLHDTGPSPQPGIKPNVKRGYYFLNASYPGVDRISSAPNQPQQDIGSDRVTDQQGRSVTQRPLGPAAWNSVMKNNQ